MKPRKLTIGCLLLIGATVMGNAWADHGHASIGVSIGPYWGAPYYPSPYYYPPPYYPPVVIERQAPPVYVEQQAIPPVEALPAAPVNYWYYCASAKAYYPYVRECRDGWQKVAPQPPAQP